MLSSDEASLRKLLRVYHICQKSNNNQIKGSRLVAMGGRKMPEVKQAVDVGKE